MATVDKGGYIIPIQHYVPPPTVGGNAVLVGTIATFFQPPTVGGNTVLVGTIATFFKSAHFY